MIVERPKQRISVKERQDEKHYVNNMRYYIDVAVSANNMVETEDHIEASNGVVPKSTYDYVLRPLTGGDGTANNLPGVIRDTDFITPIREKNIGEYIELPNAFTVKVDDPNASILKSKEVADEVKPYIEQAIINVINSQQQGQQGQGMETGVPSTEQPDIQALVDDTLEKWVDERAVDSHLLIKSVLNDNDFDTKRLSFYNDWWSTEKVYIYTYIQNGALFFERIGPLEGYPVSNGYEFVDDQEAFLIKRKLTIDRIEEYYSEDLSDKDRDYLEALLARFSDAGYSISSQMYQDIYGRKAFDEVDVRDNTNLVFSSGRDVDEYILLYKTQVERKILYYYNELEQVQQRVIEDSEDFEFDDQLGHITVEKEWISEVWKQVLLGEENNGIYLKPKPVDVQIYDDKGHNKLPIIGKKGIVNGTYINPIPARIIPNLALHRVLTLQIERQIAKFKGTIEVIPQSMIQGDTAETTKGNMFYKIADNTIIYDDTKVDWNTVSQGYKLMGNDTASNFIKTLIDYRDVVKAEAWDMANMNDGRYGNAAPSSTVTNNQQNIFNAKLGSVLSITTFNNVLVRLYEQILTYMEFLHPEGTKGTVFEDNGSIAYFNIDSGMLTANKFGIHMTNAVIDFNKLKEYKDFAFAAGQHGEFELATAAIEGDSISAIRTKLNEYIKSKKEFEQSMQQQEIEQTKRIHDEAMADKDADRKAKHDDMITQEEMKTDRDIQVANIKANDVNKNNN